MHVCTRAARVRAHADIDAAWALAKIKSLLKFQKRDQTFICYELS